VGNEGAIVMAMRKKPSNKDSEASRSKQNGAGANRGKTRPDVPSTQANKAATGKISDRNKS
jgi:hypothetical protein